MPPDSPMQSSEHQDGPSGKIVDEFEWAMFVKTLKEPGGIDRLRIALKDDGPDDGSETRT